MTTPLTTTVNVGGQTLPLSAAIRDVEMVELIKVTAIEGQGVYPDPKRPVEYWFTKDGALIARRDAWKEGGE